MAAAALFLAAKVEEQPRKLEHVIKVAHMCLNRDQPPLDTKSEVSLFFLSLLSTMDAVSCHTVVITQWPGHLIMS